MFTYKTAFSGFSVDNKEAAEEFYQKTLGLEVVWNEMALEIKFNNGLSVFAYPKEDHQPATFTILNFMVEDIDAAVDELNSKGVTFEWYENMPMQQDEKGIARGIAANMGPDIAWFKDPAGNILSLLQN